MKVCIYGAGAIGGWIGTRLARAGCEVGVVARGATLDALQLHGLRLDGIFMHVGTPEALKEAEFALAETVR